MNKNLTGVLVTLCLMCALSIKMYSLPAGGGMSSPNHAIKTATEPRSLTVKHMTLDTVILAAEANALGEDILIAVTEEYGYKDIDAIPPMENYRGYFGIPGSNARVGDVIWTDKVKYKQDYDETWIPEVVRVSSKVLYVGPASDHIVCLMSAEPNRIYMFGAFSKGQDGRYSETYASAAALSPVKLPLIERFVNLRNDEENPFVGWNGTTNFRLDSDGGINTPFTMFEMGLSEERQEAIMALPPIDVPADSNLVFSVNTAFRPGDPGVIWNTRDSIVVEVSADGWKTVETVRVIHTQTLFKTDALMDMTIRGYSGKQVLLRVRAVVYNRLPWSMGIYDLEVRSVALCNSPRMLQSVPVGGDLRFGWQPSVQGETEWQVGYTGMEAGSYASWSESLSVEQTSYDLKGLEDNGLYRFRVRAVCGVGQMSGWEEIEVRSNRVPTFIEDFSGITGWSTVPVYWKATGGMLNGLPVQLEPNSMFGNSKMEVLYWKTATAAVQGGTGNHALAWNLNAVGDYALSGVLVTPTVRIDASERPMLVFDLAYGKPGIGGKFETLTEAAKDHRLELYVSTDGGNTFSTIAPLRTWNAAELAALKDSTHIEIDLSKYDGLVSFAFGVFGFKNGRDVLEKVILYLDNAGVVNTKATARDLKVSDIGVDAATVSWVADKTVPEWLVKLEGGSSDTIFSVRQNTVVFSDLQARSEYTASVAVAYASGDTAAWKSISFITGGERCDAISEPKITDITQKTASLSWNGSSDAYRIRIRPVSEKAEEWTFYKVEGERYTLKNLLLETQYEGGIQALCSSSSADTSTYVDFAPFTTPGITCNTPYSLLVVGKPTQTSALLTWSGEAESYQVEWWLYGKPDQPLGRLTVDKDTCMLTDLFSLTNYEFRVRSICGAGDTSFWSEEIRFFRTSDLPISCIAPSSLQVEGEPTVSSAVVVWKGEAAVYQVEWLLYFGDTDRPLGRLTTESDMCTISGLQASTSYKFRVRGICMLGDTSAWSRYHPFYTGDLPECPKPTDLKAESVTSTTARLSWKKNDEMLSFILRYSEVSEEPQWESVTDLTNTTCMIWNLKPKTAYVWSILSECSQDRYSGWTDEAEFVTEGAGNESRATDGLFVTASIGQIHVMNPSAAVIDRILLYSAEGVLIENYTVRRNENVLLTTGLRMKVAVVVVESAGRLFRFKVLLP